jgi:hypothetical protein
VALLDRFSSLHQYLPLSLIRLSAYARCQIVTFPLQIQPGKILLAAVYSTFH